MADEMRKILKERFEKQDIDEGFYDVTFKIGDKLLHAHRFLLSAVSEPFQAMFSDKWQKTSDPIEIKACSFETFKQFIAYFYHGTCKFDESIIFDIINLAEIYQIQSLKNHLDIFLSEMSFTDENIYKLLEVSEICKFENLKNSLSNYLVANWEELFERADFLEINENVLMGILGLDRDGIERIENALFEEVFDWTEKQVKEKNANFESLEIEEQQALIKTEMAPFLPKFKFGFRSMDFLNDFVAEKSYLFDNNWDEYLEAAENNTDDFDLGDRPFFQKFQILPQYFNGRYHRFLRGVTWSITAEPVEELVGFIKTFPKENGAYISPPPFNFYHPNLKFLRELEYDEDNNEGKYCLGFRGSSLITLINSKIFSLNQVYYDVFKIVCNLEGENFPDFDEEESSFCIQLL